MSLTSLLRPGQPLKTWFETSYPNIKFMQSAWRSAGPPELLAPEGGNAGLVGTAFDYRLRFFFAAPDNVQRLVAHRGTINLDPESGEVWTALDGDRMWHSRRWDAIAKYVTETLIRLRPAGIALSLDDERVLTRLCCLLGRLEVPARTGNRKIIGEDLLALGPTASVEAHLDLVHAADIDDVVSLIAAARSSAVCDRFGERFVANPTFAGSSQVGGADADFIIGDTLVEIKTSIAKSLGADWAWQLLGYLLLDWDDALSIRKVAFYGSRHRALFEWNADDALSEAAGHSVRLEDARAEFMAWCVKHLPIKSPFVVTRSRSRSLTGD